jgi:hypothetical protein
MFSTSLDEFGEDINKVESILKHAETMEKSAALQNIDFLTINTMCDASITLLCAYFEGFIRDLGAEYSREIVKLGIPFTSLPTRIIKQHLYFTPEWIHRKRPKIKDADLQGVAIRYASPFRGDVQYELIYESFGDCLGNPNIEIISKRFSGMDIDILQEAKKVQTDHIILTYDKWLSDFIDLRNSIAHGERVGLPLTVADVRMYLAQFTELANYMNNLVNQKLLAIKQSQHP